MEQPVWLFYGFLAVIIGLGIVGSLLYQHNTEIDEEELKSLTSRLSSQADFVCKQPTGTRLGIDAQIPSKAKIYTDESKICIEKGSQIYCDVSECKFLDYEMNLNSSIAKRFDKLEYRCYVENKEKGIEVECRG